MRFKAQPFKHAEYDGVRERSEKLSQIWLLGHVYLVLFASVACAMPFLWVIAALIDSEIRERIVDLASASTGACIVLAAVGFAIKRFAKWKASHIR